MNLSILIPCFNWDTLQFINEIKNLCEKTNDLDEFEIIMIEDGSSVFFQNKKITELAYCKYEVLAKNIGRSAIRNLLAKKAKYSWLLFIDCDSKIATKKFIENYLHQIKLKNSTENVYYGETTYEEKNKEMTLHRKYGIKVESKSKKKIFSSHHFLIHKSNFQKIQFNKNIKSYGYEDVIFQIKSEMKFKNIKNELYHIGLKDTKHFINDCESGLKNLTSYTSDKEVIKNIKILRYWKICSILKIDYFIVLLFKMFKKHIIKQLYFSNPNLFFLQLYKLGFFCQLKKSIK